MTPTREEIIKALRHIAEISTSKNIICTNAANQIESDAERIAQLEAERDNWKADYHDAVDKLEVMEERAVKAESELKEAVEQMRGVYDHCAHCAHCECKTDEEPCCSCANASNWKWRGSKEGEK